jgi:hypothetical protein
MVEPACRRKATAMTAKTLQSLRIDRYLFGVDHRAPT